MILQSIGVGEEDKDWSSTVDMHAGMFQDPYDPGTLNSEAPPTYPSVRKYPIVLWNPCQISLYDLSRIEFKMIKHQGQRSPGLSMTGGEQRHLDLLPSGLLPMKAYSQQDKL